MVIFFLRELLYWAADISCVWAASVCVQIEGETTQPGSVFRLISLQTRYIP